MDDLLQCALVGTAKRSVPAGGHETDVLVAQVATGSAERSLLLRAGSRALYQRAGYTPERISQAPTPAAFDCRPVCSGHAAEILAGLLGHGNTAILLEALRRLEDACLVVPPELLPRALDMKGAEVRTALRPVLGERGHWLSQFQEEWHWAVTGQSGDADSLPADAERIWQEGCFPERRMLLQRLRAREPASARQWLKDAWAQEKADKRAELLESFAANLSQADMEFLEQALDDRSIRVRAVAARLLARLRDSALAQRMLRRAETMLAYTPPAPRKIVLGAKTGVGTLTITPPKEFDKQWECDGIQEKPPTGLGARTYWMVQVMALVPPSHWETHFGCAFSDLITAAALDDFGFWLLQAWSHAALLFQQQPCIQALWDYWRRWQPAAKQGPMQQAPAGLLVELWHAMEPKAAECRLTPLVQEPAAAVGWSPFLPALPHPWSLPFAKAYLAGLRKAAPEIAARQKAELDDWYVSLTTASVALPDVCFADALEAWEVCVREIPENSEYGIRAWRTALDKFAEVIRLRSEFIQALEQPQIREKGAVPLRREEQPPFPGP